MVAQIDESRLSHIDRLGLAYCRLICYEWDEIVGPKPDGFDELPAHVERERFWRKKRLTKENFVRPVWEAIKSIIGEANCSRCWWLFKLGKTEEEWFHWYVSESFKKVR